MFFCFFFQYCVGRWSICDTTCDILCVYGHPAVNLLNSLVDRYCLSKRPGLWFRHWIKWGFFSNELSILSFIGNLTLIVLSEIWALLSICLKSNPKATATWNLTFFHGFQEFCYQNSPSEMPSSLFRSQFLPPKISGKQMHNTGYRWRYFVCEEERQLTGVMGKETETILRSLKS